MYVGASTANFYPMNTEDSLDLLVELGFRDIEVFINTQSEAKPDFIARLRERADNGGARIRSLHPYLSGTEPYLLFSAYERRFQDGLRLYDEIFRAAMQLGASYVIMHGDRQEGVLSYAESISRYERVYDLGQEYGVTLLQENVVHFRSSQIPYILAMKEQLGTKARFVLDLKQCIRSGYDSLDILKHMGTSVAHVHISDHNAVQSCLMPGKGTTDYDALFHYLGKLHYVGGLMLELYRENFQMNHELIDGKQFLLRLLNNDKYKE